MRGKRKEANTVEHAIWGRSGAPRVMLAVNRGAPKNSLANIVSIFRAAIDAGILAVAWDLLGGRVVITGAMPIVRTTIAAQSNEWSESDSLGMCVWLQTMYDISTAPNRVGEAIQSLAQERPMHPVREWLEILRWDGTERVRSAFVTHWRAEDSEYVRRVAEIWLVSAVARAYEPGCQVDYLPIFIGPQGNGKSQTIRALAPPEWYAEPQASMGSKDLIVETQGRWIVCFDELASIRSSAAVEAVKAFLTRRHDVVRLPYGRYAVELARSYVCCGTTNNEQFLIDITGNRRLLPVVTGQMGALNPIGAREVRDQIWAEAVAMYKRGVTWHPEETMWDMMRELQEKHREAHPWEEILFELCLSKSAESLKIGLKSSDLYSAIGKEKCEVTQYDSRQVGAIMRKLGYVYKVVNIFGKAEKRWVHRTQISKSEVTSDNSDSSRSSNGAKILKFPD